MHYDDWSTAEGRVLSGWIGSNEYVQGATVFPSAIGLGASFDPKMVEEAAAVIHDETRAMGYVRPARRGFYAAVAVK